MCQRTGHESCLIRRRQLLAAAGATAAGLMWHQRGLSLAATTTPVSPSDRGVARIRVIFLYPPTAELKQQGYYSWPGSTFDAEGHQRQYTGKLTAIGKELGIRLRIDEKAATGKADAERLIAEIKAERPDGLLLVPFKKSEWEQVKLIISQTGVPTIAAATMGVLLMSHIQELRDRPGVHLISSLDNFEAMREGLNLIRTARWMRDAVLLSVTGDKREEYTVPVLGTRVRRVPMARFIELYRGTSTDAKAQQAAQAYLQEAKERREPTPEEVAEAARALIACRQLIEEEKGDAMMMACLEGISKRQIPPPCLPFMSLRDEGLVAGCQNDLDATLTMMLGQQLLGRPGFQHNPACDTEKNLYYGSHCTSPRRLSGPKDAAQPYILRSHAEAGIGAVPQVLWPKGMEITVAQYVSDAQPRLWAYAGKTVGTYDMPPAGGCRTNLVARLEGIGACDVKAEGMLHPTIFAGNHLRLLKSFCQMHNITWRA